MSTPTASHPKVQHHTPRGGASKQPAAKSGSWGKPNNTTGSSPRYHSSSSAPGTSSGVSHTNSASGHQQPRGGGRGDHRGPKSEHHSHQGASVPHNVVLPAPEQCPRIVDIGANLAHRDFNRDLPQLLERAQLRKVTPIIVTGTSVRASEQASELCKQYPGILYSTAGVHPHDAKSCDAQTIGKLRTLASQPHVLAIGECGLDFDRNFSTPKVQEQWFVEQLKLAGELKMPVFLHERSAHQRFVELLEANKNVVDLTTCVVHCFTGTAKELETYLAMGMYIGITGWVTNEQKGQDLRAAVSSIPLDRIMIETDAPFLAPRNARQADGKRTRIERNEPEMLHLVLEELAYLMGVTPEELAKASTENAHRFFSIPEPATTASNASSSAAAPSSSS